jgi:hypothetical protein
LQRTKLGKINRTIITTELNALYEGNRVSLDEREQMRERLSRRARLRVGLAGGGSALFSCAPRSTPARQLEAGQAEPVALSVFGTGCSLNATHRSLRKRRTSRMCQPR